MRSLNPGGAEQQLINLASSLHQQGHEIHTALFYSDGFLYDKLAQTKTKIHDLQKKGRWHTLGFLKKYVALVRVLSPDVILCYMTTPNIYSTLCKPLFPKKTKIVYGVRASNMDLSKYGLISTIIAWFEAKLSRFADLVICNSNAGLEHAKKQGFCTNNLIAIPNGIDTTLYFPDRSLGQIWRQKWCDTPMTKLIGTIGRLDPMKDYPTFLAAAAILCKKYSDIKFICIADGEEKYKTELFNYSKQLGLENKVVWLPAQNNLNSFYNALDIFCLSSAFGEGFPNVIGEAMACNLPCIATDVGDATIIINNPEQIVPPKNPKALAEKLELYLFKKDHYPDYRSRIENEFSVEKLATKTLDALHKLLAPR